MRKYFTWRCIGLHVLVLIIVPTFFLLGRWQYHAARAGNTLSWAYTFEWPLFGLYAIYMWWKLIHEQSTAWERLWAAKNRSAAAASGIPLEQVPGWALDKGLSRAVTEASLGTSGSAALPQGRQTPGLESQDQKLAYAPLADSEVGEGELAETDDAGRVVDAHVVDVKEEVDEELLAYNRYLAELNRSGPAKRW